MQLAAHTMYMYMYMYACMQDMQLVEMRACEGHIQVVIVYYLSL